MSGYAYQWAKRQHVGDSSAKTLLKTYAHWAAEDYTTWVTNDELVLDTEYNIQTIRKARDKLIELGYLIETRQRKGETRSIIVYQMVAPEGSTVVQSVNPRDGETITLSPPSLAEIESKGVQKRSPSKSGTPKGVQIPSPSKSQAPPDLDGSPSKSHVKPLQISPEAPPDFVTKKGLGLHEKGEREQTASHALSEEKTEKPSTDRFDRFWAAWPSASGRKTGRDACFAEWQAQGFDGDTELIVMHVEAMKRTPHWRQGFDPTPIRYLEERNWRDGNPEPAKAAPAARDEFDDGSWWESDSGINAKGKQHGVEREKDEPTPMYLLRVCKAAGRGPWIDHMLAQAKRSNSDKWYRQVVSYLGEALMPTDFYAS